ncbi:prolyl 3-hydroxylase OGFOD1 [Phymastichus coffea]|uniref:prolyl 3-hydroxylase OGFOD1 n=1 Tax=Phymastichus coffea TaxID=108790 RepID=UPI00273B9226|nr:prolyl 3-hydroxylase OGFOD1 [Phymastichus coffea]XP_058798348.1 prolyl 3-hydroxylase OGFOD1 [Phymastichus coffea]
MAFEEPKSKKIKHSNIFSEHIFQSEFQEILYRHWHGKTALKNSDLEIIAEPFRVCKISNFLDDNFIEALTTDLEDVRTRRKSLDLYQFRQSRDLSRLSRRNVISLYHSFQSSLCDWMQKNTEISLDGQISMSTSCYSDTDHLLCHDDNLGNRKIAFILYLSKNWIEEDGGALELFDTDKYGQPRKVVKSLLPEYNSLVIFEVANNSYHQVAEVRSKDKIRWSINGWFHGPVVQSEKVQRPKPVINYIEPEDVAVNLLGWITDKYFIPGMIKQIQEEVETKSVLSLANFLEEEVYMTLSKEIESEKIKWISKGPADVCNYEVAEETSLPTTLAEFYEIFKSATTFEYLGRLTGLDLHSVNKTIPAVTMELQRWSKGSYTLIDMRHKKNAARDNSAANDEIASVDDDDSASAGNDGDISDSDTTPSGDESTLLGPSGSRMKPVVKKSLPESSVTNCSRRKKVKGRGSTKLNGTSVKKRRSLSKMPKVSRVDESGSDDGDVAVVSWDRKKRGTITARRVPETITLENANKEPASDIEDYMSSPPKLEDKDTPTSPEHKEKDKDTSTAPEGEYGDDDSGMSTPSEDEDEVETPPPEDEVETPPPEDEVETPPPEDEDEPSAPKHEDEPPPPGDQDEDMAVPLQGSLDVIMQFHTNRLADAKLDVIIDYVDPTQKQAGLACLPCYENHLTLVYKTTGVCRLHRYVNHYLNGYFYTLVCTYVE